MQTHKSHRGLLVFSHPQQLGVPACSPPAEHGFRFRKAAQTLADVAEEAYLRTDVSCGVRLCQHCPSKKQQLPEAVDHYVIPDASALQTFLEIFEMPEFQGCIVLTSVLREVQRKNNVRLNARLRSLVTDSRRGITVFDNLHCLYTAPTLQERCKGVDVLKAARFYDEHLDGRVQIVVLQGPATHARSNLSRDTAKSPGKIGDKQAQRPAPKIGTGSGKQPDNDDVLDELLGLSLDEDDMPEAEATHNDQTCEVPGSDKLNSNDVAVMAPADYFACFWSHVESVRVMVDSLLAAQASLATQSKDQRPNARSSLYAPHLSSTAVQAGLDSGTLIKGTLHVSTQKRGTAKVLAVNDQEILLANKKAINRALHGDSVAVKISQHSQGIKNGVLRDARITEEEELEAVDASDEEFQAGDDAEQSSEAVQSISGTAAHEAQGINGEKSTSLASSHCSQGQVVGIVSAISRDIVACIEEVDEATITETGKRESVLCVPLDRRLPKMRLRSTQLSKLKGQRFVVRLDSWEANSAYPSCHLVKVLGPIADSRSATEAVLASAGIEETAFSKGALQELPVVDSPEEWVIPEPDIQLRRDLRGTEYLICSIDPPGCTDVDDCLSVRLLPKGGVEIGVHIADVSHFVHQGSFLDAESAARGTTVYLIDRRLDMLPALLSEHLCSLRQGQDRLAVSVLWTLDSHLSVTDTWFGRTIIRSKFQLAYKQAQDIADGIDSPQAKQVPQLERTTLKKQLEILRRAAFVRKSERQKAGALELESSELTFETSAQGHSQAVSKEVVPMMGIVAEMMIWANQTVAQKIFSSFPTAALVRRHPPPPLDAFHEIASLCESIGTPLDVSSAARLSQALEAALHASGDPATASLIKGLATRAMREAQYMSTGDSRTASNIAGHFGLGLEHYTHFTSPIRRYADIVVHRQLLASLEADSQPPMKSSSLAAAADVMNERTRQAKIAQRECTNIFFLASIQRPRIEDALVYGITPSSLQLFLPSFGMRAMVFLYDKQGQVKAPLTDVAAQGSRSATAVPTDLYRIETGTDWLKIIGSKTSGVEVVAQKMARLRVSVTSHSSRSHGPVLQVDLLRHDENKGNQRQAVLNRKQLVSEEAQLRAQSHNTAHTEKSTTDTAKPQILPPHHSFLLGRLMGSKQQQPFLDRCLARIVEESLLLFAKENASFHASYGLEGLHEVSSRVQQVPGAPACICSSFTADALDVRVLATSGQAILGDLCQNFAWLKARIMKHRQQKLQIHKMSLDSLELELSRLLAGWQ